MQLIRGKTEKIYKLFERTIDVVCVSVLGAGGRRCKGLAVLRQ